MSCLPASRLKAQDKVRSFEFSPLKKCSQVKSLYKTIDFLDSREDTSCIGILSATERRTERLVLQSPVRPQLEALLDKYAEPNAGSGELLFQLRRFSWAEPFKTRYVYLAASLYVRQGDRYLPLANLDREILVARAGHVESDLADDCRDILHGFLSSNIGSAPKDPVSYSMDELNHLDSLEKRAIPVYNTTKYIDGFYGSYEAFRQQTPDLSCELKLGKDGTPASVKVSDKHSRQGHDHIYALVYQGVPYVVTHLGIWPLEKVGDEFYFTAWLKTAVTNGEQVAAQLMVGLAGRMAMESAGDRLKCRSMIDHQNGEFIHLKVLETEAQ